MELIEKIIKNDLDGFSEAIKQQETNNQSVDCLLLINLIIEYERLDFLKIIANHIYSGYYNKKSEGKKIEEKIVLISRQHIAKLVIDHKKLNLVDDLLLMDLTTQYHLLDYAINHNEELAIKLVNNYYYNIILFFDWNFLGRAVYLNKKNLFENLLKYIAREKNLNLSIGKVDAFHKTIFITDDFYFKKIIKIIPLDLDDILDNLENFEHLFDNLNNIIINLKGINYNKNKLINLIFKKIETAQFNQVIQLADLLNKEKILSYSQFVEKIKERYQYHQQKMLFLNEIIEVINFHAQVPESNQDKELSKL